MSLKIYGNYPVLELERRLSNIRRIITEADLSENYIVTMRSFIPINVYWVKLKVLKMDRCNMSKIQENALVYLTSLQELHLKSNQLSIFTPTQFRFNTKLLFLYLDHNKIVNILSRNFLAIESLVVLNLPNNELDRFENYNLPELKYLDLSKNRLVKFCDNKLPNLLKLNLKHNFIRNIPLRSFDSSTKLTDLLLSHNLISRLLSYTFSELSKLETLKLSSNPIKDLPLLLLPPHYNLLKLSLKNCVFANLSNKHFDCGHNEFGQIVQINLSNNHLVLYDRNCFRNIRNLKCVHLMNTTFFNRQIPVLVDSVQLECIKIRTSSSIDTFPDNNILPYRNLKIIYLEFEDLQTDTNLAELPIVFSNSLRSLELVRCRITALPAAIFRQLYRLDFLNLSFNKLSTIEPTLFDDLYNLLTLKLNGNCFRNFTFNPFESNINLERVYLDENPDLKLLSSRYFNLMTEFKFLYLNRTCDCGKLVFGDIFYVD